MLMYSALHIMQWLSHNYLDVFTPKIRRKFFDFKGGIPFSAVTFEVSFLSVITLLPVSVIYHLKAYVVNFENSHIILIWLPWQRY